MSPTHGLLTPTDTEIAIAGSAFIHLDGSLHGSYKTADFASAIRLVDKVGEAADAMNHHPDVRLGWGNVTFRLHSHDAGGVTARDVRLARTIQELAEELGATNAHAAPARYDIAIDCGDADSIRPFWLAGLGYQEVVDEGEIELVDPSGIGPRVWFQHMEIARTERNRIHIDVYVPAPDAEARVQSIIDVGGVLITDEHAPDWWVLADVEGNELCVCTTAR
ncbi:MAG: VOC family protein [Cryobacterium sp.]